jgi:hypothetical protein
MVEPVVIGSAGVKFLKDASTQLITISNTGNSATPKEMYSSYLGTWQQFVVPINSKFIPLLIQINISESGGSGTGNVILSDGTPGTPSNTWWECNVTDNQSQENNPFCSFDVYLDGWSAGEYVNVTMNTTDYWGISILGILTTT